MNKHLLSSVLILLTLLSLVSLSSGCKERFTEISASSFKTKWDDSMNNSAESWWYLGEDEGYHYIIEKRPLKQSEYKISKEHLGIKLEHPKEITFTQSEWVNLKTGDVYLK